MFICWWYGLWWHVIHADITGICIIIMVIDAFGSLKCGANALRVDKSRDIRHYHNLERLGEAYERDADTVWYITTLCPSLGMLGTVIGFAFMMYSIGQMDLQKVDLKDFGAGMATALYTTGVGLVSKDFLRFQTFIIERARKKFQHEE